MPSAAPIRPATLVSTQQGVETLLRNDLTPFRKACIFTTLKLRENTCPTGYRGLKIFTPLCSVSKIFSGGGSKNRHKNIPLYHPDDG